MTGIKRSKHAETQTTNIVDKKENPGIFTTQRKQIEGLKDLCFKYADKIKAQQQQIKQLGFYKDKYQKLGKEVDSLYLE